VLDYGSWISTLRAEEIAPDLQRLLEKSVSRMNLAPVYDGAFCRHFGLKAMPEELNERHELLIVGSEFDPILKESSHEDTRSCADALGVEEVIPALGDP